MARAGLKPDTVITINIKGKMTNEEKIQEIDRQIERVINRQEERIADYSWNILFKLVLLIRHKSGPINLETKWTG